MNKIILLLTICFLAFQACNLIGQPKNSKMVNVNVADFKAKMQEENTVILDVRTPKETAEGKIAGAIELDVKANNFKEKVGALDKNKTYLVYCRSGRRSVKACGIMEEMGLEKLYNLEGGYQAWSTVNKK